MKLKINENFQKLIPPLTKGEYKQLKENLLTEGWRDNEYIILWNDFIIDGHNRYKICMEHNIDFKTTEKKFDSEEDAKIWMINNQKGRRNLTDGWKWELIQTKKQLLLEKGREKLSEAGSKHKGNQHSEMEGLSTVDKVDKHNTRKKSLKRLGGLLGR